MPLVDQAFISLGRLGNLRTLKGKRGAIGFGPMTSFHQAVDQAMTLDGSIAI